MAPKTSEKELEKKAKYYQENKERILANKHKRQEQIYINKVNRNLTSEKEFEKEFMRKLSKLDNIRPDACELCGVKQKELGYPLEGHHFNYNDTKMAYLCKPCHSQADRVRRRQEPKPLKRK